MKYLKKYEQNNKPEKGDYVICNGNISKRIYRNYNKINNFIENNIGKIIEEPALETLYTIKYENVPYNINNYFRNSKTIRDLKNIIYFSDKKEDVEAYLNTKKYNL